MNKGDEYAANAAECQRMALAATSEQEMLTWLEIAEHWLHLAAAEQQQQQQIHAPEKNEKG
jgi:hypothetical protein